MGGAFMPDIIDTLKVAETIKSLMKKRGMTQDQLAEALSISKSAVSQNLRGKSSFDIQNLIQIAKLFEITLDELLSLKDNKNKDVVSEYQKATQIGLSALQQANPYDLSIATPDLYGKVLIDYIIDERKKDMFLYIDQLGVTIVQDYYHRSKDIYLKIIRFLLEEEQKEVLKYIYKYTELNGSFEIDDEVIQSIIWGLLDQEKNKSIVLEMMNRQITMTSKIKSILKKPSAADVIPLSRLDYIDMIAAHKLKNVLQQYLISFNRPDDLVYFVELMVIYEYHQAIDIFIDHYFSKPVSWMKRVNYDVQKSMLKVMETYDFDLIIKFARLEIYTDMTQVVKTAISQNNLKVASYLIANYHQQMSYRKIAEACVENGSRQLLDEMSSRFTQDDLNHLLAWAKKDDQETLLFLIDKGAKIDEKYYNLNTFAKVNALIDLLRKKGN